VSNSLAVASNLLAAVSDRRPVRFDSIGMNHAWWARRESYLSRCAGVSEAGVRRRNPERSRTTIQHMVGEAGIEPTTPGLEGRCSIRLSYSPTLFILAFLSPIRHLRAAPRTCNDSGFCSSNISMPRSAPEIRSAPDTRGPAAPPSIPRLQRTPRDSSRPREGRLRQIRRERSSPE
jgi:hypothetical protein